MLLLEGLDVEPAEKGLWRQRRRAAQYDLLSQKKNFNLVELPFWVSIIKLKLF